MNFADNVVQGVDEVFQDRSIDTDNAKAFGMDAFLFSTLQRYGKIQ